MAINETFEAGFVESYKAILGDIIMVPLAPLTPLGQTDFRMGHLAGIRAAGSIRD
jgi:hypothetical protein